MGCAIVTNKDLKTLIKLLQTAGVVEYRTSELTLVLSGKSSPRGYKSVTEPIVGKTEGQPQYNEEDTLFWSTPTIPEDKEQ